jgi:hypothetical protein
MLFKFKKSKITVDCFTHVQAVYELYKIRKAILYYPDEIKSIPPWIDGPPDPKTNVKTPTPSIKQCTGIQELYKHGAIIPFWVDYYAQPKEAVAHRSRLGTTDDWYMDRITEHPREQFPGFFENYVHIKFGGVWNLVDKTGTKFLWMPATWNLNNAIDNFIIPQAVTYYDTQPQTNLNMFIRKDAEPFHILSGTPIAQIIPLTDKEVDYKCHFVSIDEWERKNTIPAGFSFTGGLRNNKYFKAVAKAKELDALEKKAKCPFGFGR